jgi:hypothetical protein
MRSRRGSWLGSSLLAASFVLVPAATTVRAQPGFGPDPFWPYNAQYTPYVTAIGPAEPGAGQGGTLYARDTVRNANQFQSYLDSLQGEGRINSDRANIGMPYYRSAVDPSYDPRGRGSRQYQPNARANERFEDAQKKVADTYFRYYAERDPSRRAELLKEYREARHESAAYSSRGRSSARAADSSTRADNGSRRTARSSSTATGRYGPAPDVPSVGTRRSSSSPAPSRRSTPTDVLNRSRAMDRDDGSPSGSTSRGSSPRSPARPSPSTPAPESDDNP